MIASNFPAMEWTPYFAGVGRTPPPNPLPATERGRRSALCLCSPSPLRGGGWGEGFAQPQLITNGVIRSLLELADNGFILFLIELAHVRLLEAKAAQQAKDRRLRFGGLGLHDLIILVLDPSHHLGEKELGQALAAQVRPDAQIGQTDRRLTPAITEPFHLPNEGARHTLIGRLARQVELQRFHEAEDALAPPGAEARTRIFAQLVAAAEGDETRIDGLDCLRQAPLQHQYLAHRAIAVACEEWCGQPIAGEDAGQLAAAVGAEVERVHGVHGAGVERVGAAFAQVRFAAAQQFRADAAAPMGRAHPQEARYAGFRE